MARMLLTTTFAAAWLIGIPAQAEVVGKVKTDWVGNDIVIEAILDPKVQGVTCHLTYFERSLIDRLQQGNWFEDPSNSSIACQTTGPVTISNIDLDRNGEEVFTESRSLIFKKLVVNRIYDRQNNALIYLAHTRQVQQGSAKMSISTVPLYNTQATWTKGHPQ
ncbi:CREA protein [Microvirga sp. KLBC 81]|uniref:CreA family protein n=1 Tax=Microvirga sp. KLBC 81 TaxID=1862707 RepID=UPI000D519EAF|nr:CreA family protein [Microvirga sp. KLBC 81]PVE20756.1 CREA protein [Microvirga sp. KLBC 81]